MGLHVGLKLVVWICLWMVTAAQIQDEPARSRGAGYLSDNEEEPSPEYYAPNPSDPVRESRVECDKDEVTDAYLKHDLDYFLENYLRYWSFVDTQKFHDMKAKLAEDPDTEVCYNVEVKNETGYVMGAFKCPLDFEDNALTKCCGFKCAQFCCSADFYSQSEENWGIAAFFLVLFGAAAVGVFLYFYLGR